VTFTVSSITRYACDGRLIAKSGEFGAGCDWYRINGWKELVKTWHLDGVIIVGVPF